MSRFVKFQWSALPALAAGMRCRASAVIDCHPRPPYDAGFRTARSKTPTRTAFLTDVHTCALEGGIGYWATCSSYRWSNDPRATIEDIAGDPHVTNLDTIARGVNAIVGGAAAIPAAQRRRLALAVRTNSAEAIDAIDADAVVQTALFGSPVYG